MVMFGFLSFPTVLIINSSPYFGQTILLAIYYRLWPFCFFLRNSIKIAEHMYYKLNNSVHPLLRDVAFLRSFRTSGVFLNSISNFYYFHFDDDVSYLATRKHRMHVNAELMPSSLVILYNIFPIAVEMLISRTTNSISCLVL